MLDGDVVDRAYLSSLVYSRPFYHYSKAREFLSSRISSSLLEVILR